jgi:tRNA threonylcarbamoyladenosine biosynthesis protein TsaE
MTKVHETVKVVSAEDTAEVATAVARMLPISNARATVLTLEGELGAGKTTFTQALARALGVTDTVTSPTFVVMKRYPLVHDSWSTLIHIDLYRLEDEAELAPLRIREDMADPRNLIVIEWPERAPALIPEDAHIVHIHLSAERSRTITYHIHGT